MGRIQHQQPHLFCIQDVSFQVLLRLPTPPVPQPGHTLQPQQSFCLDQATGRLVADPCAYLPGRSVHVALTKNIPIRGGSRKLAPRLVGLFTIIKVISPTAVRLPTTMSRVYPTFHISRLNPAVTRTLCSAPEPPPSPRVIDGRDTYAVNRLLDCRRRGPWLPVPGRLVSRKDHGLLPDSFWVRLLFGTVPPVKTPRGVS